MIQLARKANTAFAKWGNKNTTLARYNIQAAKNDVNAASHLKYNFYEKKYNYDLSHKSQSFVCREISLLK